MSAFLQNATRRARIRAGVCAIVFAQVTAMAHAASHEAIGTTNGASNNEAQAGHWQTTLALFDDARPAAVPARLPYADDTPPRGGTLRLANYIDATPVVTSYDSLNPFLLRGNAAPAAPILLFETLMQRSLDDVSTQYPLLADRVAIAPDGLSATFHLNPAARFSNGRPVTADDVVWSFECL
ncbi:MAG: ABC transporter substrate-binding protein, partial [Paraburkholderia tropica]